MSRIKFTPKPKPLSLQEDDLIYDRKRVGLRLKLAKSFLKVAEYCLIGKLWGPFVDNLFSAAELTIQSILLLHHNPKYSLNQSHEDTRRLFSQHTNLGNFDVKYSDHYIKLEDGFLPNFLSNC